MTAGQFFYWLRDSHMTFGQFSHWPRENHVTGEQFSDWLRNIKMTRYWGLIGLDYGRHQNKNSIFLTLCSVKAVCVCGGGGQPQSANFRPPLKILVSTEWITFIAQNWGNLNLICGPMWPSPLLTLHQGYTFKKKILTFLIFFGTIEQTSLGLLTVTCVHSSRISDLHNGIDR